MSAISDTVASNYFHKYTVSLVNFIAFYTIIVQDLSL